MITFNQKTDSYRPKNRVKEISQVDIVKTLDVRILKSNFFRLLLWMM
jgi:hypothetical protein